MNDNAGFATIVAVIGVVLIAFGICESIKQNSEEHTKQEAMRAGLVNKIENGQPIWVKP